MADFPPGLRRWTATLLGAIVVVALGASRADAERQVRMAILEANLKKGYEAVAAEYEKIHPDVRVSIQVIPGDGYVTWIRAAMAGGEQTAPDIFNINMTAGYFEAGKVISLKPYLLGPDPYTGKRWVDSFYREYIEMARSGADYPQIPLSFVEIGFFYNEEIFDRAGVRPPSTWAEMIGVCKKLKEAGVTPLAIGGDLDSYWQGTTGWLVRVLCDAYFFEKVPVVVARPGDFLYDPAVDGVYRIDPRDPYCDLLVNIPVERVLQAILDGDIRFDGPEIRETYARLREFSQYWQRGFHGAAFANAYQLFLTGKSAMLLASSSEVMRLMYDMEDVEPDKRFDWGIFRTPDIADSPIVKIRTRGAGGPLPVYGVVRKSKEQQDLAADFLMYLLTPPSCKRIMEETLRDKQPLVGPFAVKDVPLPEALKGKYEPFFGLGREKIEFRGLKDEQESVWRWCSLAQDYMAGRMTLDEFCAQYQRVMVQAIPRVVKMQKLDMDPRTRDNNDGLFEEIRGILATIDKQRPALRSDKAEFVRAVAEDLRNLARAVVVPESGDFALVEERTIPFLVTTSEKEFGELTEEKARALAKQSGYQYLAVVLLTPTRLEYRLHNFRPSERDVVRRLEGKRYSRQELKELLFLD